MSHEPKLLALQIYIRERDDSACCAPNAKQVPKLAG